MTPCARDGLLASCVAWGALTKHDNGCKAYAQGWPQGANTMLHRPHPSHAQSKRRPNPFQFLPYEIAASVALTTTPAR
eukprot:gene56795-biopygen4184